MTVSTRNARSGDELIVDEVNAPVLIAAVRRRHGAAVETQSLLPSHPHPYLQSLEAVQPVDALLVIPPAFTPQHDPNPHVAEARSGLRDLPDPQA